MPCRQAGGGAGGVVVWVTRVFRRGARSNLARPCSRHRVWLPPLLLRHAARPRGGCAAATTAARRPRPAAAAGCVAGAAPPAAGAVTQRSRCTQQAPSAAPHLQLRHEVDPALHLFQLLQLCGAHAHLRAGGGGARDRREAAPQPSRQGGWGRAERAAAASQRLGAPWASGGAVQEALEGGARGDRGTIACAPRGRPRALLHDPRKPSWLWGGLGARRAPPPEPSRGFAPRGLRGSVWAAHRPQQAPPGPGQGPRQPPSPPAGARASNAPAPPHLLRVGQGPGVGRQVALELVQQVPARAWNVD